MDASRFAAAALPPYRGPEAGGRGNASAPPPDPDAAAAKAAAAHFDALYGDTPVRRRRYSPLLIMTVVFSIGAGAGLAGARWVGSIAKPQPQPQLLQAAPAIASAPPSVIHDADGQATALRGIRASELPYDGRRAMEEEAGDPPARASSEKEAAPKVAAPKEGASKDAVAKETATKETATKEAATRLAATRESSTTASPAPATSAEAEKPPARAAVADDEKKKANPDPPGARDKPAQRAEAEQRKTSRTVSARSKDREIERMRQQAEEELGRKTTVASAADARRSPTTRDETPARPSRLQLVTAELARCEQRSNIILREQCRWRVCNGMWGRNGCPSYTVQRDPY
ncbi:MAG TPA: hypothetical protein VIM12_06165 [Noviherbaspirillum sp.]|uniref:hypothetical protein n=1 Tax=Noviherbaspirillum sp. TaxID=1926288 RepID=UPI002F943C02